MPLFDLPMEILLNITDYLDDSGMNALARTNKDVHSLLNEVLYRRDVTRSRSRSLIWAVKKRVVGTIQRAVHASRHLNPVPESFSIVLEVPPDKYVPITQLHLTVKGNNPNFYSKYPLCIEAKNDSAIVKLLLARMNIDWNLCPRHYQYLISVYMRSEEEEDEDEE
ncbi:hypothetical protein V8E54_013324 [Elaphomyces granulatus]